MCVGSTHVWQSDIPYATTVKVSAILVGVRRRGSESSLSLIFFGAWMRSYVNFLVGWVSLE